MPNCSFCDEGVRKGTGILYVKKDGTLFYFCSSKCRKNTLDLGREGRRQKWTRAFRVFKGKEKKTVEAPAARASKKPDKPAEFAPGSGVTKG